MNDQHLDKAVEFLVTMRPGDHSHNSTKNRYNAYRAELCAHLQIVAALRMAGFGASEPRLFRAEDLVRCKSPACTWAGPVDQLRQGLGQVLCPVCNNLEFERIT